MKKSNQISIETKDFKKFLPGLEPKKVENRWSSQQLFTRDLIKREQLFGVVAVKTAICFLLVPGESVAKC